MHKIYEKMWENVRLFVLFRAFSCFCGNLRKKRVYLCKKNALYAHNKKHRIKGNRKTNTDHYRWAT